ncbi:Na+-driven multidrug efflux pump [Amycolatopsis sulphurea]|uniref:Probable multidrug resistance protein NorM n=1 Tax=Amycolatopsis sulphurea TaxID=76022 RepID=A0A2A9FG00_9PSEU|nr:MATE family efflux transporter [Amycolatopsis sulphurea]PFG49681.1 Na+-driven multidrug efflux pump [Amycolatopsis sulphurea]
MQHTQLTARNYGSFASLIVVLGFATTGVGAVDLAMIAPKGVQHVAAVGQGDLLVTGVLAFFLGVVESFSSRLALAEGERTTAQRLPVLAGALLVMVVLCQLLAFGVAAFSEPALTLLGQKGDIVPLIGDYVSTRMLGAAFVVLYYGLNEALKICGARNMSLVVLLVGLGLNAVLDWAFLYTGGQAWFASPESAVAASTVAAQLVMVVLAGWMFAVRMRARGQRWARPSRRAVTEEFLGQLRTGPGVGARHLNDYAGSVVPVMFIGATDVQVLAAALVATKIYTLFCRFPQACFEATFVFYGYSLGRADTDHAATVRTLRRYAAAPTALAAVLAIVALPWEVDLFAGEGLDHGLAQLFFLAYMLYLPAYFFEQMLGRMLTVHRKGGLLFTASTTLTYLVTIPLAWVSVFVFHSVFLAIASKGVATVALAYIYWRAFRTATRSPAEVRVA